MKKLAKLTALSLATVMVATSCGTKEEAAAGGTDAGTPAASESTSLRVFGWQPYGNDDTEENKMEAEAALKWIKDNVGLDAYFNYPQDDYNKQLASTLASGEKYDFIYFQQGQYQNFVEQGALTDLTPYIEASPILSDKTILPQSYLDALKQDDGKIYALPNKFDGGLVPTIRKDWLAEFGMEVPTTLEQWEAYFAAAKEQKGALGISTRVLYDIQPWASAFGLTNGVAKNADGTLTVPYANSQAVDMWKWFNDMYTKGYFDPNFETNSSGDFRNAFMAGQVASVSYWQHWVGTFDSKVAHDDTNPQKDTFDTVAAPPVMKDGKGALTYGELSLLAIPANAENPQNAIKFIEAFYQEPGNILGTIGYEGIDYTLNDKGEMILTDVGIEHALNHSGAEPVNTNWVYPESVGGDPRDADELEALGYVMDYGFSAYYPSNNSEIMDIVAKYGSMAIKGSIPAEEAVASMQADITALGAQKNQNFVFN